MPTKKALGIANDRVTIDSNGFLRVEAILGSESVMPYVNAEGKTEYGYLPKEELVKAIDSYQGMPLTLDHPKHKLVTKKTYKEDSVGFVDKNIAVDEQGVVRGEVVVCEDEACNTVARREVIDLSGGYRESRDYSKPGIFIDTHNVMGGGGGKEYAYDFIKRDIQLNHLAICPEGRNYLASLVLDSPDYTLEEIRSVSLDSTDFIDATAPDPNHIPLENSNSMPTKHIACGDGVVEITLDSASTLENYIKQTNDQISEMKAKVAEQQKLAEELKVRDSSLAQAEQDKELLKGENDSLKDQLSAANDAKPTAEAIASEASERIKFWAEISGVATDSFDPTLSVTEAKRAYVCKALPDRQDLATATDAYIEGCFSVMPSPKTQIQTAVDSVTETKPNIKVGSTAIALDSRFEATDGGFRLKLK